MQLCCWTLPPLDFSVAMPLSSTPLAAATTNNNIVSCSDQDATTIPASRRAPAARSLGGVSSASFGSSNSSSNSSSAELTPMTTGTQESQGFLLPSASQELEPQRTAQRADGSGDGGGPEEDEDDDEAWGEFASNSSTTATGDCELVTTTATAAAPAATRAAVTDPVLLVVSAGGDSFLHVDEAVPGVHVDMPPFTLGGGALSLGGGAAGSSCDDLAFRPFDSADEGDDSAGGVFEPFSATALMARSPFTDSTGRNEDSDDCTSYTPVTTPNNGVVSSAATARTPRSELAAEKSHVSALHLPSPRSNFSGVVVSDVGNSNYSGDEDDDFGDFSSAPVLAACDSAPVSVSESSAVSQKPFPAALSFLPSVPFGGNVAEGKIHININKKKHDKTSGSTDYCGDKSNNLHDANSGISNNFPQSAISRLVTAATASSGPELYRLTVSPTYCEVLREVPVYVLRRGGFPKRLVRKKVWLTLNTLGVILRKTKDSSGDGAVVHSTLSLLRPVGVVASDSLAVGMNGLQLSGSEPVKAASRNTVRLDGGSSANKDGGDDFEEDDDIDSALGDASLGIERDTHWVAVSADGAAVDVTSTMQQREVKQQSTVVFQSAIFEVAFEDKDTLSDWVEALESQRQLVLTHLPTGANF